MNSLIQLREPTAVFLVALGLTCFGLLPKSQPLVPPPDGCYPNFNTAEGCNALSAGGMNGNFGNSCFGWYALFSDSTGSFNTGVGAGALVLNNADSNTAVGAAALLLNTSGSSNTAVGTDALVYNDSGYRNNAVGTFALYTNTDGYGNNAVGYEALYANTSGFQNAAIGGGALFSNTTGSTNVAVGTGALYRNSTGSSSTAVGMEALYNNIVDGNTATGFQALFYNTTGIYNTANGYQTLNNNTTGTYSTATGGQALFYNTTGIANNAVGSTALDSNTSGSYNTALGDAAGYNATTGDHNVYIGAGMYGAAGESNACYIASIYGQSIDPGSAATVSVDANNKLGTIASAVRFKKDIKPIDDASKAILALKPVTFHYKTDRNNTPCFGLIAEEVAEANPDLIVRDKNGKIYSVRYDAVNAMLLNEFLKEHRKVEEQQATIAELKSTVAQQQKGMEALTTGVNGQAAKIQRVDAQLELNEIARQTVLNNQ